MHGKFGPNGRLGFLSGSGTMCALIRAHDWKATPLGSPDGWPQGLKTLAGVMLGSHQPMFIAWGPERTLLYNDAYAEILARKHPSALGRDFLEVWHEIRADLLPIVEKAYGGESVHMDDITLIMERRGYREETHFSFSYTPVRDESGAVAGFFCPCTEITGQVMAERRLAAETERQRRLFEQAPGFITALTGPEHVFEFVNQAYRRLFGDRGYIGRTVRDAFPELVGQGFFELLDQVYATGERFVAHHIPIRFQATPDAALEERFLDFIYEPVLDEAGRVTGIFCEGQDVTEAHLAQAAISASNARYTSMLSAMSEGFVVLDREFRLIEINAEGLRLDGRAESELLGRTHWEAFPPSVGTPVEAAYRQAMIERIPVELEHRYVDEASGHDVWLALRIYPVSDGVAAFYRDISETKRAEEVLRASEAQFRAFAQAMPNHVWTSLPNGQLDWFNDRVYEYSGASPGELNGERWTGMVHPDDLPAAAERWAAALSSGANYETEFRLRRMDGAYRWHIARAVPIHDEGGALVRWIGTNTDIEDQKAAGEAIRKLNVTLAEQVAERTADRDRMWRLTTDVMLVARFDATIMSVNPAWTTLLGWREDELLGKSFLDLVHPDDVAATVAEAGRLSEGITTLRFENRYRHKDGSYRWLSWIAVPDEQFIHAVGRDVTGEKEQVQALRQAEEALRQSQKMEAVGQLTGGIAHDFNNLLTGIVGSLDIMQTRIVQGRTENVERYAKAAMSSAQRAAALTHRLLAFSRRQPLDPKPVNANQLVASMEDLLRRTIGPLHALEIVTAGGLWTTLCDPNQLESAILNLAINARDAMPDGGRLTIEMANAHLDNAYPAAQRDVTPGQYVAICISDTGTGMPPDVIERAFEPFFTTKPTGQGTGLGLSMVYGFAKQSEGHLRIYSEVGTGTTIKIYLPRYRGAADEEALSEATPDVPRSEAGETVLVVEDEPVIRDLIVEVLQELGYRALEAADGPAGLKVLQSRKRIDLLITDVGLPGINGRQVADQARVTRPDLKVLFITGYAENATLANGFLEPGMEMITKPFAVEALATRVRAMIKVE
ncbi:PAS domain-containing protein [Microvirga aerilata]|uniref:histidine kinase n=2 Tax=Microvirga aerilata TaxID=670292 RepID=A0A937D295_9HYPH|nr:PAS domain-containing protein [Microvirga aerilata]